MTGDYAALLRGMLLDPADDLPRLILADWLDWNGQGDRAEFVRLQIEFSDCAERTRRDVVESRLEQIGNTVVRDTGAHMIPNPLRGLVRPGQNGWEMSGYRYERGFLAEIRLPLAAFLSHAKELFETHPIERVVLTDVSPSADTDTFWREGSHPFPSGSWCRYFLPVRIYDLLENAFVDYGYWKSYETPEAARDALSAAAVAYGRELAGLPPLTIVVPEGGTIGDSATRVSNDRSSGHNS